MESLVLGYTITTAPNTLDGAHTIHAIEAGARNEQNPSLIRPLMWPLQTPTNENVENQKPQPSGLYDQRDLDHILDPANSHLLVTEEATGNAVAYVSWQHQRGKSEKERAELYKQRYRPPGLNHSLADATVGVRMLKRAKILGNRDCMGESQIIMVLPLPFPQFCQ